MKLFKWTTNPHIIMIINKQCDNDVCRCWSLFSWIFTWVMADSSADGVRYMCNAESKMSYCAYWYWHESLQLTMAVYCSAESRPPLVSVPIFFVQIYIGLRCSRLLNVWKNTVIFCSVTCTWNCTVFDFWLVINRTLNKQQSVEITSCSDRETHDSGSICTFSFDRRLAC